MRDWAAWQKRTDKGWAHNYLEVYASLLRGRNVKSIFEVGILGGMSVRMWAALYPEAQLVAIDIDDCTSVSNEVDAEILVGDAYSQHVLDRLSDYQFDLIVEDGSHTLRQQCWAAENYPKLLTATGVLVIEDVENMESAHLIQQFVPDDLRRKSYIIDRRSVPSEYGYRSFAERNDIMVVVDL